ncbi:MAG: S-adenosylmethionine:tRNA ribosyltransferase-isomerase [Chitinophagaceae bacterium]|nr:S-adenosylmethionine:tRNA ribosyltransferase-isomerase [Chitinophagaceae bacterium]
MHPKDLEIKNFTYNLPDTRIAKYPLEERDQSKLLVYQNKSISSDWYRHISDHLPENTLLLFNNTKVVEARILFQKATGGTIEIFCLEPDERYPDITTAMLQKGKIFWKCLVGGAKKWKEKKLVKSIQTTRGQFELIAEKVAQYADYYLIEFSWEDESISFAELLHLAGLIPLPPYLNRNAEASDINRYQTIYAKYDGSVAAPTAGLHFTELVFEQLKAKHITHDFVTLHVGAGTFKPVKTEKIEAHEMHAEFIEVTIQLIQKLLHHLSGNIVPVGTTSMRTIESLYWLGVKIILHPTIELSELVINQWDPYDLDASSISATASLEALIAWMQQKKMDLLITKTQIIIAPGYDFKIANALITNFHQPQSTLLLLVSALIGDDWKKVYQYALEHEFRFLSYGDGCLLWR